MRDSYDIEGIKSDDRESSDKRGIEDNSKMNFLISQ